MVNYSLKEQQQQKSIVQQIQQDRSAFFLPSALHSPLYHTVIKDRLLSSSEIYNRMLLNLLLRDIGHKQCHSSVDPQVTHFFIRDLCENDVSNGSIYICSL